MRAPVSCTGSAEKALKCKRNMGINGWRGSRAHCSVVSAANHVERMNYSLSQLEL